MVAFPRSSPVNPLLPPVGGVLAGLVTAAVFALMPQPMLEDWVWASGLPAVLSVASPPLGITARAVLALAGGAMAASVAWSLLYLLVGPGGLLAPRASADPAPADAAPAVRRADAHPDAPPRRPMTAADLGTPLMEVSAPPPPIEQPLPHDLEQPLAAFHPGAIPEVPLPAPDRVAPLARQPIIAAAPVRQQLAPGERIDAYVLTPPAPVTTSPSREPAHRPSIDALLRRLEDVAERRMALGR